MPYAGRGGAGNIQAVDEASKRIAEDIEANHGAVKSYTLPAQSQDDQQYARVGRGGAGNFYSSQELSDAEKAGLGDGINSLGSGAVEASKTAPAEPTRTFGRGGAGNFSFDSGENQDRASLKKLEEDEQKKLQLNEQVEKGVEQTLAMPPKAKLPRAEPEP